MKKKQNIPLSVGRACHVWKHRLKATHMRHGGKGKIKNKKKALLEKLKPRQTLTEQPFLLAVLSSFP